VLHVAHSISVLCVFKILQTVIKELNLKFKTKENPYGTERAIYLTVLHLKLKA
jgi:hypothetical protein